MILINSTVYPTDYQERLDKYNKRVRELEEKRKKFYEDNPDFPIKTMYMNVCAPPMKLTLNEYE